jgi:hypothetical protein
LCDEIDNDCDGFTDSDIMDLSGHYQVQIDCIGIIDTTTTEVRQEGCSFDFTALGFDCAGSFEGTTMEVQCEGIPLTCVAEPPVDDHIHVECMENCTFDLVRLDPECDNADCSWPGGDNQGNDADGDDWGHCCDCDDGEVTVHPGANEVCDQMDNDCNGYTDEYEACVISCDGLADWDPCADGLFCTKDDYCLQGECQGGPTPCDDPDPCYEATCFEDSHFCQYDYAVQCLEGCQRDSDCPAPRCCQLQVTEELDGLTSWCMISYDNYQSNTGEPCSDGYVDCCSGNCTGHPGYCLGLCLTDNDCPTFQGSACQDDSDCDQGYLCEDSICRRRFSCMTLAFNLASIEDPEPLWVFDTECKPDRRACGTDADCRPEEACRYFRNVDVPEDSYQCDLAYSYTGELGDQCDPYNHRCRTGMCRRAEAFGHYICTKACVTDADCGEIGYYCDYWNQDIGGAATITRRECQPGIK